ncbi:hypothetical protein RFI_17333, partial [Reticulomyxa filosa]
MKPLHIFLLAQAKQWEGKGMKTSVLKAPTDGYVRVLSNEFVLEMLKCMASWLSSEVMRRIFSQCMMEDVDKLGHWDHPFFDRRKSWEVTIPGWVDEDTIGTKRPVKNAPVNGSLTIFTIDSKHTILFTKPRLQFGISFSMTLPWDCCVSSWMCVPEMKKRACQVLTFAYDKLSSHLHLITQTQNVFNYSGWMASDAMVSRDVCRTHNLLGIALDNFMHWLCGSISSFMKQTPTNRNTFEFFDRHPKKRSTRKRTVDFALARYRYTGQRIAYN